MLVRFCLYGFLKNQRYFEPFLLLALLDKLDGRFLLVGWLYAVREVAINLLEIPSGAAADLFGRRRTMLLSFGAYLASFVAFGQAESFPALAGAMVLFGVGEAFRSGTHKALIFTWLTQQGRVDEKTRVYGLTRSFSKIGSAISALLAAGLVYAAADYNSVFYWSLIPCGLSVLNLLTYPAAIDPLPPSAEGPRHVVRHMWAAVRDTFGARQLRRLVAESMGFHGVFQSLKDYLQPILAAAVAVWLGSEASTLAGPQQAALILGPAYSLLFLASALASYRAHRFATRAGGDDRAATRLWTLLALALVAMVAGDLMALALITGLAFVALHVLQNLWRPIMTSRIYSAVPEERGATVLSVESQGHRLAAAVLAPLFGGLLDATGAFWPAAALALTVALTFRVRRSLVQST